MVLLNYCCRLFYTYLVLVICTHLIKPLRYLTEGKDSYQSSLKDLKATTNTSIK